MRGKIVVTTGDNAISNIHFDCYEGDWSDLPDFTKLKAIENGKLPDGHIDFGAIPSLLKRHKARKPGVKAGLVVTANLRTPDIPLEIRA